MYAQHTVMRMKMTIFSVRAKNGSCVPRVSVQMSGPRSCLWMSLFCRLLIVQTDRKRVLMHLVRTSSGRVTEAMRVCVEQLKKKLP